MVVGRAVLLLLSLKTLSRWHVLTSLYQKVHRSPVVLICLSRIPLCLTHSLRQGLGVVERLQLTVKLSPLSLATRRRPKKWKRILASGSTDFPYQITNHKVDLPELQGDPIFIAKEKAALAAKEVNGAVITEDTSLCFTALNDLPGPYIKWFLDKNGLDGLNDMISFSEDKSGYAQTVVAYCQGPGDEVHTFDGRTLGTIVRPRGSLDFGWDPIFQPDEGNGLTYAEMTG